MRRFLSLEEGHYRIQGSAHLEDVGVELDFVFEDEGEYDTLAGFLTSRFGYIPQSGETYDFDNLPVHRRRGGRAPHHLDLCLTFGGRNGRGRREI